MKLRRIPEDFQVDEQADVEIGKGPHALWRLTKRSIGTPEAVAAIVERWRIPRKRISYGGLNDRHAVTTQYVTIQHGPRKNLEQTSLDLRYLGQTTKPFRADQINGNRFELTMRDMSEADVQSALQAAEAVRELGLPNYFDNQRFGSLGFSGEWIGKAWCLSDYERALWLALADPNADDRSQEKKQKRILAEHWGDWVSCKAALDRSHRRSIVTFLADKQAAEKPVDFRGAFARINVDLRGLYLSAFQSALWNRLLTLWLKQRVPEEKRVLFDLKSGPGLFGDAASLEASDFEATLPLPSARQKDIDEPIAALLNPVLAEEDLELRQLRVKFPRDSFFSKSWRPAIIRPGDLTLEAAPDELYAGKRKIMLCFELPRGCYATILIKRLSAE
ncbi:MAG: tRNA pseudouridine(13) synthase TruD [Planctomycetes bacterium]|nr:tRNA pseudouridine(13) synthase TruD [Planctomycetota bacterium]